MPDETHFLSALKETLETGETLADEMIRLFETDWGPGRNEGIFGIQLLTAFGAGPGHADDQSRRRRDFGRGLRHFIRQVSATRQGFPEGGSQTIRRP